MLFDKESAIIKALLYLPPVDYLITRGQSKMSNKRNKRNVAVKETPDVTPEVTPDVTPEVTPDVTPEVTPEVTPDVTPDAPDVTPDIELKALQGCIEQENQLKEALKAAQERTKALANTVLTSERYQELLENLEKNIKTATEKLEEVSPAYFTARQELDQANIAKISFCKLYGKRAGHKTNNGAGNNGNMKWLQLITVKKKFLTISLQYDGIVERFEGILPIDPEEPKILASSSWLAFRTNMVNFFSHKTTELDADSHLLLRAKLSSVKRALEAREYNII